MISTVSKTFPKSRVCKCHLVTHFGRPWAYMEVFPLLLFSYTNHLCFHYNVREHFFLFNQTSETKQKIYVAHSQKQLYAVGFRKRYYNIFWHGHICWHFCQKSKAYSVVKILLGLRWKSSQVPSISRHSRLTKYNWNKLTDSVMLQNIKFPT